MPSAPSRLGVSPGAAYVRTEVEPSETPRKDRPKKGKTTAASTTEPLNLKRVWETLGLAVAFVAVLGLVAYYLWPAGAKTLHAQAAAMMASENPADWSRAERDPIAELDQRFPDLYRDEKAAWRDKILLEKARRRAAVLEKPNLGRLSEPSTEPERLFVDVFNQSAGALKDGRDEDAIHQWKAMADVTRRPEERGWKLLAEQRASALQADLIRRRESVVAQLEKAKGLEAGGKKAEAEEIRKDVIRRYGKAPDLRKLIEKYIPAGPDPAKAAP